jgi:hypothetical protein
MRLLTARERRLLALGGLALALALVWLLIIGPLVWGFTDREAERRRLIAAYQLNARLIGSLPVLRAAAVAQRAGVARFAVLAPSEPLAAEAVKQRLQHLAAEEGFTIGAVEDLQADAAPATVKLRVDMTASLPQFYETIRRLESEDAYVVVDFVSVTADRSLAAGRLAPLDVRLELSADWRPAVGRP